MANTITPPNWHEDQPSAMETALATQLGAGNKTLAGSLLQSQQQERYSNRGDYLDQLAQNNALQRQNMQNSMREAGLKEYGNLVQHAVPGALDSARSMFGDLIPAANPQLDQSVQQRFTASNTKDLGQGYGPLMQGGAQVDPGTLSRLVPGVTGVGSPAMVQAAEIRGKYGLLGDQIKTAGGNKTRVELPVDPNDITGASGKYVLGGNDAASYMAAHPPGQAPQAQLSPAQRNNALMMLQAKDKNGHADVLAGGNRIVADPNAPDGFSFIGKSGRRYH